MVFPEVIVSFVSIVTSLFTGWAVAPTRQDIEEGVMIKDDVSGVCADCGREVKHETVIIAHEHIKQQDGAYSKTTHGVIIRLRCF